MKVIPAPHGTFHKTNDGKVLVLENGNARSIGRIGEPVNTQFLMNYGDTYHDNRFNGHEPAPAAAPPGRGKPVKVEIAYARVQWS